MTLQAINAQALRPAVNFKANEKEAASVQTAEAPQKENKHIAAKVIGGAAALALLGFGIYKMAKGKGAPKTQPKEWTQIKEGVREIVNKKGNKIRQYTGKNGDVLTVVKNKDGQVIKTIRKNKVKLNTEHTESLDTKFRQAMEQAKETSGTPRHLQKPTEGTIAGPSLGKPSSNPLINNGENLVTPVKPESITTVKNYVGADSTVMKKPVNTIVTGNSAEGKYRVMTAPNSEYNNVVTTAKDGTKTLEVFHNSGTDVASVKYKKGQILEQKGMNAAFDDKGQLTYEIV